MTRIVLSDLTVAYEHHPAVHHISGCFETGSLTAIVGPNGAGKSTLIKAMSGVLKSSEGYVDRKGLPATSMAYLPQAADIDRSFPLNVIDTVAMGTWKHIGILRAVNRKLLLKAHEALVAVGLEGFEKRSVGSLSAGQFQRVLFARLLLQDASVILLDEPFNAIDARTTRDLLDLVHRWHTEKRTVVAVLHDLDQVRQYFPDTLLLAREKIAWGATQAVLTQENLRRARNMAADWEEQAEVCDVRRRA